ncbi:TonB-dependent receptor [Caulobacter sp. S45]|uniref:TonB-dependent receptor n=1 Tax=Caulobacter sp. S45 TaxID=1641861 RepID=UPI001C20445C|nr:TonB-dependent receptor [Caulobacter sp. S45]
MSQVIVTASRSDLLGIALTASQGSVTQEELKLRPAYRVGQLLETVPGLVVTIHSGEGKANQYLARGFNLDHGTDIANFFDDMPINRPTNAHGQGYSDLNFIIPELIDTLDYTKGTYYPSVGDFGAVASAHMHLADIIPNQISLAGGTLNDDEIYLGGTKIFNPDDRLLAAFDLSHVDGPFTHSDNFQKYAGALRYSHGVPSNGYDLTLLYYHGAGNFTTDQPARAVQEGLIDRFGTLDPSDGTHNERLSLSGHYATEGDDWRFTSNAYFVHSKQTLWNDFTHFLDDPINGDQEQQDENRDTAGGATALSFDHRFGSLSTRTTIGIQARYDDIYIDRRHTKGRMVLDYCEEEQPSGPAVAYSIGDTACSEDRVQLADIGLYLENSTRFTNWLRADIGVREEYYRGYDHSLLPGFDGTSNFDGARSQTLLQPKGNFVFGPWASTEFYVSAGRGFHSDDVRGVTQTVPIQGVPAAAGATPLLVRADSEEVGLRSDLVPKVKVQIALFNVNLQSELIYDQDEGQDQASAPSEREGVELSAQYHPFAFLELNADLTASHARFVGANLPAFGLNGNHIPNSPGFIGSVGAILDNLGPYYGGLEIRALGSYPLTADNTAKDAGYTETNVTLGYKINQGFKAEVQIFNLFDVQANSAAYYYTSRLPGEPVEGMADYQDHPLEPISARFKITATF